MPLAGLDQTAPQGLPQQLAIASTQLQHGGIRRRMGGKLAAEPAMVAHEKIDPAQITARVERIRMLRGQRIQELGLDTTLFHGSNAKRLEEGEFDGQPWAEGHGAAGVVGWSGWLIQ